MRCDPCLDLEWLLDPDPLRTQNVAKDEARMPVRSWLSHDSVKRVDHWTKPLARPLAEGLPFR